MIGSFKMILRKPRSLMKPTRNEWSKLWDLSVHNTSLPFDHTSCFGKSELEACLYFPVSRSRNRKLHSEPFFLSPLLPTVQFAVVHQHLDLRRKQHTNSCRQHVLNLHVLVSLCSLDSMELILTLGISASKGVPHLLRFPFRHLHEIHQLVRCHHHLVLHLDSFRWTYERTALPSSIPDC